MFSSDDIKCDRCDNNKYFICGCETYNSWVTITTAPLLRCRVCGSYVEPLYTGTMKAYQVYPGNAVLRIVHIRAMNPTRSANVPRGIKIGLNPSRQFTGYMGLTIE